MRLLLRWLRRGLLVMLALAAVLLVVGPYEPVKVDVSFDRGRLSAGVGPYLRAQEAQVPGLRPGHEKRVIWHGLDEVPTDYAVVYLHGFTGSSQELRPVPEQVAQALGANLVLTRFRGHGRDGAALAGVRVEDWMQDAAEALAIAREVGDKVIVIATSTGGTIAAVAAHDPPLMRDVRGMVLISPDFGLNSAYAPLLRLPAARYWLPLLAGRIQTIAARNTDHALFWTTRFPTTALVPVAALARHAAGLDHGAVTVPALFVYSDADQVARPDRTDRVMADWGGETERVRPVLTETDDRRAHIVTGDILSPGTTKAVTDAILGWIKGIE